MCHLEDEIKDLGLDLIEAEDGTSWVEFETEAIQFKLTHL